MKIFTYFFCMIFAWFGSGGAPGITLALFQSIFGESGRGLAKIYIFAISVLAGVTIFHRIVKILLSRSFVLPPGFRGAPFYFALLSTLPIVFIIFAYVLIAVLGGTVGLSGIPLAVVLGLFSTLAPLPIIYCEIPDMVTTLRKLSDSLP